jgi:DNA helicase-2/ATP-dependent DNA helicase PcrA
MNFRHSAFIVQRFQLMDLLSGLNEPQRAAVMHTSGPLLIFAGAGSGKTRTLTHRIAYLIQEKKVSPARILAVTFTNKAAREMRERLEKLVGPAASRLWMGTFHSMCAQMLRIHGEHIGLPPRFVIFDTDDSTRLMKAVLSEADLDPKAYPPSRILGRISDAKNKMLSPDDLAANATRPNEKQTARLYRRYQERLRQSNALDFDDLLVEAVRLLQQSTQAREYWSERFLHVMIDEFQDANAAQFKWAEILASKHRNICVVGDDDQAIYKWRGANVKLILEFEEHYPDAQKIMLEQNYRSTQNILDAAHGVISKNFGRSPKRLWSEYSGGEEVILHGAANAQDEAWWVVDQIRELQRTEHLALSDFAILCRVNAQSRPFEEAFLRARMPLKLIGTQRFYERREIRDLIAYFKVLFNPNDSVALTRIINVPARGIGATTISKLDNLARDNDCSLWEIVNNDHLEELLGKTIAAKIAPLRNLLRDLQPLAQGDDPIGFLLMQLLNRTRYLEYLATERDGKGEDRAANVSEFLAAADDFDNRFDAGKRDASTPTDGEQSDNRESDEFSDFDDEQDVSRLGTFLESVALEDGGERNNEQADEAVTLMTMHSAKGLEFPVVFLPGAEQGLLPHARALWGESATPEDLEEERRLCYVGLTRAEKRIFISHAAQRTLNGRTEATQPSQFLDEIPNHLLKRSGYATRSSSSFSSDATNWNSSFGTSSQSYSRGSNFASRGFSGSGNGSPMKKVEVEPPTYFIGDRLKHPTFGEGVVVAAATHGGAGEWVEVAFLSSEVGKKKLIVAYAPLEKV